MKLIICDSKGWYEINSQLKKNNEILIISKKEELNYSLIKNFNPKYIFFVHWNWIVEEKIFSNYECILFHTSPLPYGRGGSPIQNLIIKGFNKSPVCALKMIKELDAGPIYSKIEISLEGTLNEIFKRLNVAINNLIKIITLNKIIPISQEGDTYLFKRISEEKNEIPKNSNLKKIYDRIRMIDHKSYPNAYIKYGEMKFEFFNVKLKKDFLHVDCKIQKCE